MPKNLAEMKQKIMELENLCFSHTRPVYIEKLQIDSPAYDPAYEASVRNPGYLSLTILNELLLLKKSQQSKSLEILEHFEQLLFSAVFYRDCLFDGALGKITLQLHKFKKYLAQEIDFAENETTEDDFAAVIKSFGIKKITRQKFLKDLHKLHDADTETDRSSVNKKVA